MPIAIPTEDCQGYYALGVINQEPIQAREVEAVKIWVIFIRGEVSLMEMQRLAFKTLKEGIPSDVKREFSSSRVHTYAAGVTIEGINQVDESTRLELGDFQIVRSSSDLRKLKSLDKYTYYLSAHIFYKYLTDNDFVIHEYKGRVEGLKE